MPVTCFRLIKSKKIMFVIDPAETHSNKITTAHSLHSMCLMMMLPDRLIKLIPIVSFNYDYHFN